MPWNDLLQVTLTSVFSFVVILILTRMMGKRQMSQLSVFDYVIGITIGSIAAEMATALEADFLKPLLAMIIFALLSVLISWANHKSLKTRRLLTGKPMILLEDGKLYRENLKKSHLDMNEFLTECRNSGYFDLTNIYVAMLETNGKISFLPRSKDRPATSADLNLNPNQEELFANVILDGQVQKENLENVGKDETWLYKSLKDAGITNPSDVFLASCDKNGTLNIFIKIENSMQKDLFE